MLKKTAFIAGLMFCFFMGSYVWKIVHRGLTNKNSGLQKGDAVSRAIIVLVGDTPITFDELDWEYSLHTKGVFESEALTAIPDLGSKYEKELTPLKQKLIANLIERKILYQMIQLDTSFNLEDSGRYQDCMKEWQDTVKNAGDFLNDVKDQERLKRRLCEKSIIMQYLNEKIYVNLKVDNQDIEKYYNDNKNEFSKPKRIVIRQVVTATEEDAKKIRNKLTRANFAEYAKQVSITPDAENGGRVGPFGQGEIPGVFDIAFSMGLGEIKGILKSTYGFHIIMLERRLPAVKLNLKEAAPKIKIKLLKRKKEEEYQKWIELALNTISIKTPRQ